MASRVDGRIFQICAISSHERPSSASSKADAILLCTDQEGTSLVRLSKESDMVGIVHNEPCDVASENGEVMINGSGGLVSSMTPAAAKQTGSRLLECAARAAEQEAAIDVAPVTDIPPDTISL